MRRMSVRTNLAIGLGALVFALVGCSDDAEEGGSATTSSTTADADSSTSTTSSSSTSSTTTVAPTTSATVPLPVSETVFATVGDTLVGWWDGSAWIAPPVDSAPVPPMEGAVMRSVESLPDIVAGPPENDCAELGQSFWQVDGMNGVRASGTHDLSPRPYEEIGPAPAHVDAVRAILDSEGVDPSVPVEITRVVRLDIEGDGVDEVLLEAVNLPEQQLLGNIEEGDYSVLVLRRVLPDDSVENITLHVSVADLELSGQYVLRMDLAEPVDVNGDGSFELAARWSYYEGGGVSLFELGADPAEVLIAGCGV